MFCNPLGREERESSRRCIFLREAARRFSVSFFWSLTQSLQRVWQRARTETRFFFIFWSTGNQEKKKTLSLKSSPILAGATF